MPKMMKGLLGIIGLVALALILLKFLPGDKDEAEVARQPAPPAEVQKKVSPEPEVVKTEKVEPEKPGVSREFKDGVDYRTLKRPVITDADKGEIEVATVFWYGCPHCYSLESIVDRWSEDLSGDVHFVRRPGFFGQNLWQTHAQLYYTISNMGLEDKVHEGIFNEVQNKRNYLQDSDAMAEYLNKRHGVDKKKFIAQFNSFGVNHQLQQASAKLKGYDLSGVPAIIIDGRYVVEPETAGSLNNMPVIADYLVAKVRTDKKAQNN